MPQVVEQLEALVCGGGDGKIVCETTLLGPAGGSKPGEPPLPSPPPDAAPDEPAESFRLPVEDEIDWVDRNAAAYYDRDDSTKEITNPKSQHHHSNANPIPAAKLHSSSQRYPPAKPPIIGFPNKLQHSGYLGHSARRPAANGRIFPKKARGAAQRGKSAVPESEPTSPKVSCIGRVLSDRDRNRCREVCRKGRPEASREAPPAATTPAGRGKRTGFFGGVLGFACCGQGRRSAVMDEEEPLPSRATAAATRAKIAPSAVAAGDRSREEAADAAAPAPGLGAMKRFASGRRPASWGGGEAEDAVLETKSGPQPQKQRGEGILARRSGGWLEDLDCGRDWESAGPASF